MLSFIKCKDNRFALEYIHCDSITRPECLAEGCNWFLTMDLGQCILAALDIMVDKTGNEI